MTRCSLGGQVKSSDFGGWGAGGFVHGVLIDIGISSPQLDGGRGFRVEFEGPLDMRFDQRPHVESAIQFLHRVDRHEVPTSLSLSCIFLMHSYTIHFMWRVDRHEVRVPQAQPRSILRWVFAIFLGTHTFFSTLPNSLSLSLSPLFFFWLQLAATIEAYGGEHPLAAQRIADAVALAKLTGSLPERTTAFAKLVADAKGKEYQAMHTAKMTFQALRIQVGANRHFRQLNC